MSNEEKKPLIVVKRVKKVQGGHHGGAWKIAYADFVTAMMAFFLLMWLLSSLNKSQLEGIAEYFKTPLSKAFSTEEKTGTKKSVNPGSSGPVLLPQKGEQKAGSAKDLKVPLATVTQKLAADEAKKQALKELREKERQQLEKLKREIEHRIKIDPDLAKFQNQIKMDITPDGLRVQILDIDKRPMFASGSANLEPEAKVILGKLTKELNSVPNKIVISGHTDAKPFASGERGYSNWELSADRANATRRELIFAGMADDKILRIAGLGSTDPMDKNDPENPINRRITIILLNTDSAQKIKSEN